ncbi:myosin heavy chain, cardiac muscle isoform-like isoform X2 [Mobula hypostoma]|uniref:myosin heavy chain, cardiac muscle isoform-like isoform X2 n=1 Tax=Mobula hypostoma TaxID=723540 RepID=UPI002FC36446
MTNLRKDKQELKKPIQNRLEEAGGVIASQMEMNSKRESELLRLGRELEESEKKLTSRLQQAEEAADAAQAKCLRLEKIKQQLPIKERGRLRIRNMMCWMCEGAMGTDTGDAMLKLGDATNPERESEA